MSIPYPEAALPKPDPIDMIQPEIDELVAGVEALATDVRFDPEEFRDDALRWAAMFRDDLPTCCAGHRVDALAAVQYQSYIVVQICGATDCPESKNHEFVMELVRLIGVVGRKIALKGFISSKVN